MVVTVDLVGVAQILEASSVSSSAIATCPCSCALSAKAEPTAEDAAAHPAAAGLPTKSTDREKLAEQLAKALREAGYDCVIALPPSN